MKEWSKEERYTPLQKERLQELETLHESIRISRWRCVYHVQTVTGLMGDTNGFSYFNGRWNLFYQWFPYGPVHGVKHWYRCSSEDLITWKNEGVALEPDGLYDDKGVFSGSGYPEGDTLYLPYTGNHRDENWVRYPYQLLASMDKNGVITKQEEPLCGPIDAYTEHQRDPKMFYRPEDGYYYFLLGVQDHDKKGKFLLMRSKEIRTGWEIYGELRVRGYNDFGFMVECPDLERIGDQWLLLFSPQGLEPQGDEFHNIYNNTYFIGQMDFDNLEFIPNGPFKELDRGLDFYAAQCAGQKIWPDKAVMCAWFGVSDYSYPPTAEEGYSGLQTMARILSVEDGMLKQRPAPAWEKLKGECVRNEKSKGSGEMEAACVIELKTNDNKVCFDLFSAVDHPGLLLTYDPETKYFRMDRSSMENQINTEYGARRNVFLADGLKELLVFIDHSSIEVFVNDGEYVLSARIFPNESEHQFQADCPDAVWNMYRAECTVADDFAIYPQNQKGE